EPSFEANAPLTVDPPLVAACSAQRRATQALAAVEVRRVVEEANRARDVQTGHPELAREVPAVPWIRIVGCEHAQGGDLGLQLADAKLPAKAAHDGSAGGAVGERSADDEARSGAAPEAHRARHGAHAEGRRLDALLKAVGDAAVRGQPEQPRPSLKAHEEAVMGVRAATHFGEIVRSRWGLGRRWL